MQNEQVIKFHKSQNQLEAAFHPPRQATPQSEASGGNGIWGRVWHVVWERKGLNNYQCPSPSLSQS